MCRGIRHCTCDPNRRSPVSAERRYGERASTRRHGGQWQSSREGSAPGGARATRGFRPGSTSPRTFPCCRRARHPEIDTAEWSFAIRTEGGAVTIVDVGSVHGAADRGRRRPTSTASRDGRSSARRWRGVSIDTLLEQVETGRRLRDGALVRRLHDERADGGPARRQGLGGVRVRRRAARSRARRAGPPARAAPVLLEERQVGAGPHPDGRRRARDSGSRTATTCTATPGRKSATGDRRRLARGARRRGVARRPSTARVLRVTVPGWPGSDPGQHVDIRLTAEDGYQAVRSYSLGLVRHRARRSSSPSMRSPRARCRPTSCATCCRATSSR